MLVTGAAGFSGSTLLRLWSRIGTPAICVGVDRTPTAGSLAEHGKTCDLSDLSATTALVQEVRPTLVFHLAGTFTNEFDADVEGNVRATRNLLEAIRRGADPACRTLIVGSSAEYGRADPMLDAIPESALLRPVSTYGLTKVFQTSLASFYAHAHGLHVVSVRPFNLVGPGMSLRLLTGNLYAQILAFRQGKIAEIRLGSVAGERDYIDIGDALRAYLAVLQRGVSGEIYNVGSGRLTAIAMLVRDIIAYCHVDAQFVKIDEDRGQPSDAARAVPANIIKLQQLGWAPEVSYAESIQSFCAPIDQAVPLT